MAISIRNPKVERMARELAKRKGATMTEAIADALEASLSSKNEEYAPRLTLLAEIAAECAALPDLDARNAEEILGYGETGGFADGDR